MAQNRTIYDLGTNIIQDVFTVSPHFEVRDLAHLSQTSRFFCRLLQPKISAVRLLERVIQADWDEAAKIIAEKPELMLQTVKAKDINGNTIYTSPLKYAVYVHDYYMLKIFSNHFQNVNVCEKFFRQIADVQEYFDFEPLRAAYRKYAICFDSNMQSNEEPFGRDWTQIIGGAQIRLLPRHMLKQMCHFTFQQVWNEYHHFEFPEPPRTFGISCTQISHAEIEAEFSAIGVTHALHRNAGVHSPYKLDPGPGPGHDYIKPFNQLIAVRQRQSTELIEALTKRRDLYTRKIMEM
jgi:hypothetical protein